MLGVQLFMEFYFGKASLGALVFLTSFLFTLISFITGTQDRQSLEEYHGYLYLLYLAFYLFGQVCSLFVFLLSIIYTISVSFFKKKRFEMLSKRVPPLALQYAQINLFLRLAVLCLSMGLLMGFLWKVSMGGADKIWWIKMGLSTVGWAAFTCLLVLHLSKGLSYLWSIRITLIGYLFLIISLFMDYPV